MKPELSPAMEEKVREAFGRLLMEVSPDGDVTDPDDWSNTLRTLVLAAQEETARRVADTVEGKCGCRVRTLGIDTHATACIARRRAAEDVRKEFLSGAD